jgi:hypothetical protein
MKIRIIKENIDNKRTSIADEKNRRKVNYSWLSASLKLGLG